MPQGPHEITAPEGGRAIPRPPDLTDAEWADYQQGQAEESSLLAEVVEREAKMENGTIDSYTDYRFTWDIHPAPGEPTWPSRLEALSKDLSDAADRFQLLDDTGHVPDHPLEQQLLGQVRQAQAFAESAQRAVSCLTGTPGIPTTLTTAALVPLTAAAAHTASAVQHLAETARISTGAATGRLPTHLKWRMVLHHADARRELRRAGEAALAAATEFTGHADLRRQLMPRAPAVPLPPAPPVTGTRSHPNHR
ncbi:hypothetical protein [Streptomyces sp. NPDC048340]|uniref:hypothetical protein n=1 Tax=Streptomyces sp. NPDC048340 TaxID=3365537 RepID=UPI0037156A5A